MQEAQEADTLAAFAADFDFADAATGLAVAATLARGTS